jgi:hypothetical protein
VAGSDAITYEIQDEELRKKLLMEHRNGMHRERQTFRRNEVWGIPSIKQALFSQFPQGVTGQTTGRAVSAG